MYSYFDRPDNRNSLPVTAIIRPMDTTDGLRDMVYNLTMHPLVFNIPDAAVELATAAGAELEAATRTFYQTIYATAQTYTDQLTAIKAKLDEADRLNREAAIARNAKEQITS